MARQAVAKQASAPAEKAFPYRGLHRRPLLTLAGLALISGITLNGCTGMNETEQSTLSGGAIGAGIGAAGTVLTGGCVSCGAAIGGAVGAATGYVVETSKDKDDD